MEGYQLLNKVRCWKLAVWVILDETRARFVGGNWVLKNLTEAACCSLSDIQFSWVAMGLSRGGTGKSGPSVIRKACIWFCMEMA